MSNVDLNDVALFVRVVELTSFAGVGRELAVPTSTISRAVSRLEAAVGAQLLVRSTRSVLPTAEGRTFYEEAAPAVLSLRQSARAVDGADKRVRGTLRVTAAPDLGANFLGEVVADFAARYPEVQVETILTTRVVHLVEEGVDVALRAAARLPDSELLVRKLGELEQDLYAAPRYVAEHGTPEGVEDLAGHRLVLFRPVEGQSTWRLKDEQRGDECVWRARGQIGGDDFMFVRTAVLAGAGIGLLPRIVVHQDVQAGRLVRVLPHLCVLSDALYFVHAARSRPPARIVAFRDFVVDAFTRCRAPLVV